MGEPGPRNRGGWDRSYGEYKLLVPCSIPDFGKHAGLQEVTISPPGKVSDKKSPVLTTMKR